MTDPPDGCRQSIGTASEVLKKTDQTGMKSRCAPDDHGKAEGLTGRPAQGATMRCHDRVTNNVVGPKVRPVDRRRNQTICRTFGPMTARVDHKTQGCAPGLDDKTDLRP